MAKDKVKNGFFLYFGLFLLIILAVVLIIFVVMLFMPGTSILGLEYFSNSNKILVTQTTDASKTEINFDSPNFSSVEINCSYANVYVQKNNELKRNAVYILNNSKGFVTSSNAKDFHYDVKIEGGVLKVSVSEQNAFLYFSKDIKIIFQIANENSNPLKNKSVKIKTTDGNVYVGGSVITGYSHDLDLSSLDIQTSGGSVFLSKHAPNSYNTLNVKTQSGDIIINDASISADNMLLDSASGNINVNEISSSNNINLNSEKGSITINKINGNVVSKCSNAYMQISDINGSIDFSPSSKSFASSVIKIGNVSGNFYATEARDTDFEISHIGNSAQIETSTGYIKIDDGIVSGSKIKTVSGEIDIKVASHASSVEVQSNKGNINLHLPEQFSSVTVANDVGQTYLYLPKDYGYTFYFSYFNTEDLEGFKFNNINLNLDIEKVNPLLVNSGGSSLYVKCNKQVNFYWQ